MAALSPDHQYFLKQLEDAQKRIDHNEKRIPFLQNLIANSHEAICNLTEFRELVCEFHASMPDGTYTTTAAFGRGGSAGGNNLTSLTIVNSVAVAGFGGPTSPTTTESLQSIEKSIEREELRQERVRYVNELIDVHKRALAQDRDMKTELEWKLKRLTE
ncbi:hypothetical protein BGZ95_009706 [Linnemannia exigua]|uniref:Uncharacterized protein n=1 Tax=Linnemannia exigua TaxID=604196 RepID=A0AAD4DEI9_9FUNG|nr:hypothetical protein BGZ95_009706 [Linnemannia exigua]